MDTQPARSYTHSPCRSASTIPSRSHLGCTCPGSALESTNRLQRSASGRAWRPTKTGTGTSTAPSTTPKSKDPEETYQAILKGVEAFGLDYVDLFLIHTPSSGPEGRKVLWQALERLLEAKKTRAIGVSNYGIEHLKQMDEYAKVKPALNQIELHPWCQSREHVKYCQDKGIVLEAYCPIVRAEKNDHPVVQKLAKKHNKDPAQILIRWSLQKSFVPLPKSDTPSRIKSNIEVYDFSLDDEDMKALDDQDEGEKGALAPYNLNCK